MEATFLASNQAEAALLRLTRDCDSMQWAVAWARELNNKVLTAAYRHRQKFERFLIGTHFYQTDPEVLRKFAGEKWARLMLPTGATFHPKVYLFREGTDLTAVVGSHNLTGAAFGGNSEMSAMLRGSATDAAFGPLKTFMAEQWASGENISKHLYAYEVQHALTAQARKALKGFNKNVRPPASPSGGGANEAGPSPYTLSWQEFVRQVRSDVKHQLKGRLAVLSGARAILAREERLANMSPAERKAISGTFVNGELPLGDVGWGWFGTMTGQGEFMRLVNTRPALLDKALAHIPASGDVSEAQYRAYVSAFLDAFKEISAKHVGGHPTASRLLAMKRPDRFVCVNSANQGGLCRAMGVAPTTLDIHNYWDRIAQPLTTCKFWNHPRPTGAEAEIWDGRMALLDAIYYVPTGDDAP